MPNGFYKVEIQTGIKQILVDSFRVIKLEAVGWEVGRNVAIILHGSHYLLVQVSYVYG